MRRGAAVSALLGHHPRSRADLALGAFVLALGSACEAAGAEGLGPTVELKPGQEIAFSVAIADGHVTPGARASGVTRGFGRRRRDHGRRRQTRFLALCRPTASEKTSAPVDFVATGLIGNIKIDEVKLCGRLDAPTLAHIYSGSWRISLTGFRSDTEARRAHDLRRAPHDRPASDLRPHLLGSEPDDRCGDTPSRP